MPPAVALHPFPVGDDASGASVVATLVAALVALSWEGLGALGASAVFALRGSVPARLDLKR